MSNYASREYLSAGEVAAYLGISVRQVHAMVRANILKTHKSTSGQYRFSLADVKKAKKTTLSAPSSIKKKSAQCITLEINNTRQEIYHADARHLSHLDDESVHLCITSPPYFNAKMYSENHPNDLGNIHDLDAWLTEIHKVWAEVFRTLQNGRKFFLNIMNLPIKEKTSYRTLNLVGKSIDLCEQVGFIFKRDIVWHKTNGVRAHFGTYPYPGSILINNMHEFILEFQKPEKPGAKKYDHVSKEDREKSKLNKDFWLSMKNSDVWVMKPEKSGNSRQHMAPFPVELPLRLIKAYSFVGETILDPFCGSGTALRAASMEGRNGVGYELSKTFVNYAKTQLEQEKDNLLQK